MPHGAVSVIARRGRRPGRPGGARHRAEAAAHRRTGRCGPDRRSASPAARRTAARRAAAATRSSCPRPTSARCGCTDPAKPDEDPSEKFSKAERRKLAEDWRCKESAGYGLCRRRCAGRRREAAEGARDRRPGAEKALAAGQIVSFDKRNVDAKGKISIRLITDTKKADEAAQKGQDAPGEIKSFSAHQVAGEPNSYGVAMIVPPAAAKAAGMTTVPLGAYYSHRQDAEQRAAPAARRRARQDRLGRQPRTSRRATPARTASSCWR